jgi:hypothetical protein
MLALIDLECERNRIARSISRARGVASADSVRAMTGAAVADAVALRKFRRL